MINTIWKGFPRFHVTFVIKRSLYIEFRVFRNKEKKRAGGVEKAMILKLQAMLGHDRGFPNRDIVVFLLFFYRDRGPDGVATEVPLS